MTPGDGEAVAMGGVGVGTTTAVSVGDGAADFDGTGEPLADGPTVGAVRKLADAITSATTNAIATSAAGAPKFGRRREETRELARPDPAGCDSARTVSYGGGVGM